MALLSSCGGGGGGGTTAPPTAGNPTPAPPPPPPPSGTGCSLSERQNWAEDRIDEWYLFPETLPANRDPSSYNTVEDYIDYLTATARSQGRDRFFTYLTSIQEEEEFFRDGGNVGFGFRISVDQGGQRVFVTEAFEGAPALDAGLDRGTEILAIGTSASNLRSVSDILASEGTAGLTDALGPLTEGVTRTLRISDGGGTRNVTITKTEYDLLPISPRYGAQVIQDGSREIGYINLRTFIETADDALIAAFDDFRARGITEFIIDFRYNGGGLVNTAVLMGDLLGGGRSTSDIFTRIAFRASKADNNETVNFDPRAESVDPVRIAFIGFGGTASASELVINGFIPFFGADLALVGGDTFGKPVGQIAQDREACDDRLRIVAFATENADGNADYFSGLAGSVDATCQSGDDVTFALGDPNENSIAAALDFLAGRSCTPITAGVLDGATVSATRTGASLARRELLMPARPSAAQIHSPGIF